MPARASPQFFCGGRHEQAKATRRFLLMDLAELKEKKINELTKLAKEYNVEGVSGLRKQELIFAILQAVARNAKTDH